MSRGIVGMGAGVAGTTALLRPDIVLEWARNAQMPRGTASLAGAELAELQKLVEQLSRDIRSTPSGVTIVQGDRNNSSSTMYIVTAAGIITVVYFSVFRGWKLSDLWFVSRRQFNNGVTALSTGLDAVGNRITDLRQRIQARIAELSHKQDESLAAQVVMQRQLDAVATDTEALRSQVGQIHGLVLGVESSMSEMGANQRHALHGIYILCKAVGELTQGSNIPSKAELQEFTAHHMLTRERMQGLEGILGPRDDSVGVGVSSMSERRGPFLLSNNGERPFGPIYNNTNNNMNVNASAAAGVFGGGGGINTNRGEIPMQMHMPSRAMPSGLHVKSMPNEREESAYTTTTATMAGGSQQGFVGMGTTTAGMRGNTGVQYGGMGGHSSNIYGGGVRSNAGFTSGVVYGNNNVNTSGSSDMQPPPAPSTPWNDEY